MTIRRLVVAALLSGATFALPSAAFATSTRLAPLLPRGTFSPTRVEVLRDAAHQRHLFRVNHINALVGGCTGFERS